MFENKQKKLSKFRKVPLTTGSDIQTIIFAFESIRLCQSAARLKSILIDIRMGISNEFVREKRAHNLRNEKSVMVT